MRSWTLPASAIGFLLVVSASLPAQQAEPAGAVAADTVPLLDLPRDIAEPIIDFFNDPGTLQFAGRLSIPASARIVGGVGVIGGPLVVAGRIEGDVVVVDGDLELIAGSTVTGNVTVVGGAVSGLEGATVAGGVLTYSQRLPYSRRGERIVYVAGERSRMPGREVGDPLLARSDLILATGASYNRVEGFPISIGPVFETGGRYPLRLRAEALYRTESGATLDPDQMGYRLRAEQSLVAGGALRLGGTLVSVIDPIERWHVENLESSLATFLLHKDFRDHYERRGGSAYLTIRPRGRPWATLVEVVSERHRSVAAGSPWTVFRNQDVWRQQPLVAEGRLTSLRAEGRFDTRNASFDPSHGWFLNGSVEHSLRSSLAVPENIPRDPEVPPEPDPLASTRFGGFTHATVDLRRYNRLSPDSRLNLRLLLAGSLGGASLPAQRQHALGGDGSLPGYPLFRLDCGARNTLVYRGSEAPLAETRRDGLPSFFPAYGCDRIALVQAEYRGKLNLRLGLSDGLWGDAGRALDLGWAASPDWVAFVGAGRGWSRTRADERLAVDLGTGVLFHRIGFFAAVPLRGEGGVNVFMRLGPRF